MINLIVPLHTQMNCESTIQVAQFLGKTIHTRDASNQLLKLVADNPCQKVDLDFSEVEYISRSFADQFHADKIKLATEQQKTIIVTNANEEVINMLQAVARTQNKAYRGHTHLPVYKYSTWNQLENFLLSI